MGQPSGSARPKTRKTPWIFCKEVCVTKRHAHVGDSCCGYKIKVRTRGDEKKVRPTLLRAHRSAQKDHARRNRARRDQHSHYYLLKLVRNLFVSILLEKWVQRPAQFFFGKKIFVFSERAIFFEELRKSPHVRALARM